MRNIGIVFKRDGLDIVVIIGWGSCSVRLVLVHQHRQAQVLQLVPQRLVHQHQHRHQQVQVQQRQDKNIWQT